MGRKPPDSRFERGKGMGMNKAPLLKTRDGGQRKNPPTWVSSEGGLSGREHSPPSLETRVREQVGVNKPSDSCFERGTAWWAWTKPSVTRNARWRTGEGRPPTHVSSENAPCSKREREGGGWPPSRISSEGGVADGRNVPLLETREGGSGGWSPFSRFEWGRDGRRQKCPLARNASGGWPPSRVSSEGGVAGGKKPLLETRRARVGEGNITNETTRVKPLLVALKLCKNLVANKWDIWLGTYLILGSGWITPMPLPLLPSPNRRLRGKWRSACRVVVIGGGGGWVIINVTYVTRWKSHHDKVFTQKLINILTYNKRPV